MVSVGGNSLVRGRKMSGMEDSTGGIVSSSVLAAKQTAALSA